MRKPKIGDIVRYHRYGSPNGEHKPEPSPAIITKTYDEPSGECNLFVMNPNGTYFNLTPYSSTPKGGHWSWPEEEKPKECEHEYDGILKLFCGKCCHKNPDKCPIPGCNCHLRAENPTDKAEELIEKIIKVHSARFYYGDEEYHSNFAEFGREICDLIKEYKGIK